MRVFKRENAKWEHVKRLKHAMAFFIDTFRLVIPF